MRACPVFSIFSLKKQALLHFPIGDRACASTWISWGKAMTGRRQSLEPPPDGSLAAKAFFAERTYMAKTFAGLFALIKNRSIPVTEPACIINTGGNPALFSQN